MPATGRPGCDGAGEAYGEAYAPDDDGRAYGDDDGVYGDDGGESFVPRPRYRMVRSTKVLACILLVALGAFGGALTQKAVDGGSARSSRSSLFNGSGFGAGAGGGNGAGSAGTGANQTSVNGTSGSGQSGNSGQGRRGYQSGSGAGTGSGSSAGSNGG